MQQDTTYIRGILMCVVSEGCFPASWRRGSSHFEVASFHVRSSMDFSFPASHYFSFLSKRSGRRMPPAERSALYLVYFYHRTLSALPHDYLPTLEPSTRSRISARFIAPRDETSRAHQGGAPPAGGRSPRPSGDVCAEPLRLEDSLEARGVSSSGAGLSQNGTCLGGGIGSKIRTGRTTA